MGRAGGEQPLNLADGCWSKGTIIHEMLHALGFYHEQMRSDRDNYITVNFNYIPKDWHFQFKKLSQDENTMGFPYGIESVMHNGGITFSGFSHPSITTKRKQDQKRIGQRAGFSKQDIQEDNRYYKCQGKTSMLKIPCLDKDAGYCKTLKIDANGENKFNSCETKATLYWCQKSCNKCDKDSGTSTGDGGETTIDCKDERRQRQLLPKHPWLARK